MTANSEQPDVAARATAFGAADRTPPPASVQMFGVAFLGLWLGMLAAIYYARRKQLALKALVSNAEQALSNQPER